MVMVTLFSRLILSSELVESRVVGKGPRDVLLPEAGGCSLSASGVLVA